jgi:uncharacterized SAM-binding protein YcdF (DUF218 family)
MLGRKYVFETKSTRLRRLLISGALFSLFFVAFTVSFIVYIPVYARLQKNKAEGAFFQKSPDAIAVFTGDRGRIAYALELLRTNPTTKLLISGVHAANSVETLLNKQATPTTSEAMKSPNMQIDLDYRSKNTFQNVIETVQYLKTNAQIDKVLIISSDYHIMRIKLILSHLIDADTPEFYYDSVINPYTSWADVKKLLLEAVKITRTFFILKVFREDIEVSEDEP